MAKKPPETNPFVQALVINGVWKITTLGRKGLEDGVSRKRGGHLTFHIFDKDSRCSVYTDGLLNWFTSLTTSAKDMFMWIATHLPYEQDYLEMVEEKYCDEIQVGKTTFYGARQQLTNRLIIPRTSRRNTYWVNPTYLFKGNRIDRFPEQVVELNENPENKFRKITDEATTI